jgi:hypothetical protein
MRRTFPRPSGRHGAERSWARSSHFIVFRRSLPQACFLLSIPCSLLAAELAQLHSALVAPRFAAHVCSPFFTPSGQKACLGLQPLTDDAGTSLPISRPVYRKAVVTTSSDSMPSARLMSLAACPALSVLMACSITLGIDATPSLRRSVI